MTNIRHYRAFLAAWAFTQGLDMLLDGYAPDLPSLMPRALALGTLLLLSTWPLGAKLGPTSGGPICRGVLLALYAGLALPNLAWRYLTPGDERVFASLRHTSTIVLAFSALALLLIRIRAEGPGLRAAASPTPQQPNASR